MFVWDVRVDGAGEATDYLLDVAGIVAHVVVTPKGQRTEWTVTRPDGVVAGWGFARMVNGAKEQSLRVVLETVLAAQVKPARRSRKASAVA